MSRIGLLVYLGRRVPDVGDDTTRVSVVDETYDDDPAVATLVVPRFDASRVTEFTGETHDDDPGVSSLRFLGGQRVRTATDRPTSVGQTGSRPKAVVPRSSTVHTRTEGETYDDDPGLGALA